MKFDNNFYHSVPSQHKIIFRRAIYIPSVNSFNSPSQTFVYTPILPIVFYFLQVNFLNISHIFMLGLAEFSGEIIIIAWWRLSCILPQNWDHEGRNNKINLQIFWSMWAANFLIFYFCQISLKVDKFLKALRTGGTGAEENFAESLLEKTLAVCSSTLVCVHIISSFVEPVAKQLLVPDNTIKKIICCVLPRDEACISLCPHCS